MSQGLSAGDENIRVVVVGAGGRMGRQLITAILENPLFSLAGALDRETSEFIGSDVGALVGMVPQGVVVTSDVKQVLKKADVLIDFTRPEATLAHIAACKAQGVAMVVGTTGFTDDAVSELRCASEHIPVVFAANMSFGVNVMFQLIALAAKALGDDYDIEIVETHHRHKVDAPSGTALKMGEVAAEATGRDFKSSAVLSREGITGERHQGTIGFATVRGGDVAGEHTVLYLGDGEQIEITHKARDRRHFAQGALRAAAWLVDQKPGFYDMEAVLGFK